MLLLVWVYRENRLGSLGKLLFLSWPLCSVLECLESVGQKLLFLTWEECTSELSSARNCQTIKCLSNKEASDLLSLLKVALWAEGNVVPCNSCKREAFLSSATLATISKSGLSHTLNGELFIPVTPQEQTKLSVASICFQSLAGLWLWPCTPFRIFVVSGSWRCFSWFLTWLHLFCFLFYFIYHCYMCKAEGIHQNMNLFSSGFARSGGGGACQTPRIFLFLWMESLLDLMLVWML